MCLPLVAMVFAAFPTGADAAGSQSSAVIPAAAGSHTITLITGDIVTVSTLADGEQTAAVQRPTGAVDGVHLQVQRLPRRANDRSTTVD